MILKIDNRDLDFTIDTYATFTTDSDYEYMAEYLTGEDQPEEYKAAGVTPDNFDERVEWEFNHAGYVQALAAASVEVLEDEFVDRYQYEPQPDGSNERVYDGIVTAIKLDTTDSPAFYNYTTDSYVAEYDINETELDRYINKNSAAYSAWIIETYDQYTREEKFTPEAGAYDPEYVTIAKLRYYLNTEYANTSGSYFERYYYEVLEKLSETGGATEYYNFTIKKGEPEDVKV